MSDAGIRNCRSGYAVLRSVAVGIGAVALLGLSSAGAYADSVLSVLTADGQVHHVAGVSKPRLTRMGFAESGRPILVDEYALVDAAHGGQTSFATPSFATGAFELQRVVAYVAPARTEIAPAGRESRAASSNARLDRRSTAPPALVIQHQLAHPRNANFAPTPWAEFAPQRVKSANGQRGFAVVSVGESGQVKDVEILPIGGVLDTAPLRSAIAAGVRTVFEDERRHDHAVYFAFEVRHQQVVQVGVPIVTLPMCCGPEPPCNPVCP